MHEEVGYIFFGVFFEVTGQYLFIFFFEVTAYENVSTVSNITFPALGPNHLKKVR